MIVDLDSYIFKIIEYDPTENPRGVVTADEWNTIMNLLKEASNYSSKSLQEIISDLYTAHELSSTELGNDGSRLIGVDIIPGITGTNVNEVLRNLKEQLDGVILGSIPDGSITSEKLAPNLNFTGSTLTFNTYNILTENDITTSLDSSSTDVQVPSAKSVYDLINTKQDIITIGTTVPTTSTPGNIYLQYIA
jgi:hypothetical protein